MIKALVTAAVLTLAAPLWAADARDVTLKADDGLELWGSWYAADTPGGRAVLLLHMRSSDRLAWTELAQALARAGFDVLAIDQRGYGDTGGAVDGGAAMADVKRWQEWMRPRTGARIVLGGASMGSELALTLCADTATCPAAIALSPGAGFPPREMKAFGERPVYLLAAEGDRPARTAVDELKRSAGDAVSARIVEGDAHGTRLLDRDPALGDEIVRWLDRAVPAAGATPR